ncbi:hypothetical protein [Ruegeria sp. ANG-S4]|nr:hypothetical protein [Ruegeria sp. ANG-S4]
MTRRETKGWAKMSRSGCLTELSLFALVAGALILSGLLWLAIYAVI